MVRVPMRGDKPVLKIVRKGPVSAELLSKVTGYPVEVAESAQMAFRAHSADLDLTENVIRYVEEAQAEKQRRILSKNR